MEKVECDSPIVQVGLQDVIRSQMGLVEIIQNLLTLFDSLDLEMV